MKTNTVDLKERFESLSVFAKRFEDAFLYGGPHVEQEFKDIQWGAIARRYAFMVHKFFDYLGRKVEQWSPELSDDDFNRLLDEISKRKFIQADNDTLLSMLSSATDLESYDYEFEPIPDEFLKDMHKDYEVIKQFIAKESVEYGMVNFAKQGEALEHD